MQGCAVGRNSWVQCQSGERVCQSGKKYLPFVAQFAVPECFFNKDSMGKFEVGGKRYRKTVLRTISLEIKNFGRVNFLVKRELSKKINNNIVSFLNAV